MQCYPLAFTWLCRLAVTGMVWLTAYGQLIAQEPKSLLVQLPDRNLLGLPIHWSRYEGVIIEPSGRFQIFDTAHVRAHQVVDTVFRPQAMAAARNQLQNELGPQFDIVVAGPYVLATPRGQAKRWRSRFTALVAGYRRYFEVRQWPLREPDFPLLVIVLPDRQQFLRHVDAENAQLPPGAIGSYFPSSNRCVLYNQSGATGTDWQETEATIVHEAVHQLAYNTGIHERLFENPLWLVEGLATMFEQPTVYDLRTTHGSIEGRMHPQHTNLLQPLLADGQRLAGDIESLIVSDDLFRRDVHRAYTLSWAMTFYLAERHPASYRRFIQRQNRRQLGQYTAGQRRQDFQQSLELDVSQVALGMQRLFSPAVKN